ncbi:MAG: SIS domain-containing protein [Pseudomonadota bacterium]
MLEQRIQQQFFESADLLSQTAEALSKPIADAAQTLLGCITAGGKLMLYGHGAASALAQHGAALMVGRFERERPGLAAMAVGSEFEVRALGSPGDVLLTLSAAPPTPALLAAVQAAQAKDMTVVALTGRDASGLLEHLGETDVHIAVPHERAARLHEAHTLVLHCLCDAVDLQLLGEQEPT